MTVSSQIVDGIRVFESTGSGSGGIAIVYTEQIDEISQRLSELVDEAGQENVHLGNLVAEAKQANETFSAMLVQLTRIANCTCIPCGNVDLCEVTEKVLREDGVID